MPRVTILCHSKKKVGFYIYIYIYIYIYDWNQNVNIRIAVVKVQKLNQISHTNNRHVARASVHVTYYDDASRKVQSTLIHSS
jgi:hypothetical protein